MNIWLPEHGYAINSRDIQLYKNLPVRFDLSLALGAETAGINPAVIDILKTWIITLGGLDAVAKFGLSNVHFGVPGHISHLGMEFI